MSSISLVTVIVFAANLLLGFFVWWRGRGKLHLSFLILSFSISFWILSSWQAGVERENSLLPLVWERVSFSAAALIASSLLYFILTLIQKKLSLLSRIITLYLIPAFFVIISLTKYVVESAEKSSLGYEPTYGIFWYFYTIYFLIYIVVTLFILIKKYKNSSGILKLRMKYLLAGLIISAGLGTLSNLIIPFLISINILQNSDLFQFIFHFGHFASIILISFTAYAILRYRLMDIKFVIRKSIVYLVSMVIILFIYVNLLIFSQRNLVEKYNWNDQISSFALILVIVFTIEPLRKLLYKIVNTIFYSKQKSAKIEEYKLRLILSSSLQFNSLIRKVEKELLSFLELENIKFVWYNKTSGNLENYFDIKKEVVSRQSDPLFQYLNTHSDILVTDEIPYILDEISNGENEILTKVGDRLKELKVGLVWPIGEKEELIGAFFLGQKVNREAFTSNNIRYLSNIQLQMTEAVANALLYKQAVERIGKV